MSLDLTKFASPGTYVCVARTGSGKSHVLKFILYHLIKKGYIKDCIAASTTARMNDDYDFLDKRFILTDLKEDNLAYLMKKLPGALLFLVVISFPTHSFSCFLAFSL